ncbi:MAG: CDP-alcohol phosphatidyltransferase family protein [Candidatus Heimdallarchaeota archaeon]|nr:CDP-alcohol phosphatidyltransferase family protein [Candidatus Heimdallarchaeota archaeon]
MSWWRNFKLKTRSGYKKIMLPFGRFIGKMGISPNAISMISAVFAIASATMYAFQGRVGTFQYWWAIGFPLMFIAGMLDVVDGSVARAMGKTTKFGQVLDPVMDRFVEFCYLMGIAIGNYTFEPLESLWAPIATISVAAWCLFSFAGMIFASYSRARGESVAQMSVESVGIMERREKIAILVLGNILYIWWPVALPFGIILVGLLSFITTIQRMFYIRKIMIEIGNEDSDTQNASEEHKEENVKTESE